MIFGINLGPNTISKMCVLGYENQLDKLCRALSHSQRCLEALNTIKRKPTELFTVWQQPVITVADFHLLLTQQ